MRLECFFELPIGLLLQKDRAHREIPFFIFFIGEAIDLEARGEARALTELFKVVVDFVGADGDWRCEDRRLRRKVRYFIAQR